MLLIAQLVCNHLELLHVFLKLIQIVQLRIHRKHIRLHLLHLFLAPEDERAKLYLV